MDVPMQFIFISFFVALAFYEGSAQTNSSSGVDVKDRIKCYACSSFLIAQNCDSPDETTPTAVCEADETMCRKVEQHINIDGDDKVRTFRGCAKSGELGECLERTGTYRFKSWYCQCKGNLCNGAGNVIVSSTLIASLISAIFLLKRI